MHQIPFFSAGAPPRPHRESLQRSPDYLARFKGAYFKGKGAERRGNGRERIDC